jgi:hypothetical protein
MMIMWPRNLVCFGYVIAYTLRISDNKYNNNNNNNNDNSVLLSQKDRLELNSWRQGCGTTVGQQPVYWGITPIFLNLQ